MNSIADTSSSKTRAFRILFFLTGLYFLTELVIAFAASGIPDGQFQWSWRTAPYYLELFLSVLAPALAIPIAWDLQRGSFLSRKNLTRLSWIAACCGIQLASRMAMLLVSQAWKSDFYSDFWSQLRYEAGLLIFPLHLALAFLFWVVFALLVARAIRLREENRLTI